MEDFYLALGVTILLPFLQWAFPTIPWTVAYAGVGAGTLIMLSEFLDASMKPPFGAAILFLIGVLCIGAAGHLYLQALKKPAVEKHAENATQTSGQISPSSSTGPTSVLPTLHDQNVNREESKLAADPKPPLQKALDPAQAQTVQNQNEKRPWLEASKNSEINAKGAVVAGTIPGIQQFAKADDNSKIDMSGALIMGPDAPTRFPDPDATLQKLSTSELLRRVNRLSSDLKRLQKEHDGQRLDQRLSLNTDRDQWWETVQKNKALFARYGELFQEKISQ